MSESRMDKLEAVVRRFVEAGPIPVHQEIYCNWCGNRPEFHERNCLYLEAKKLVAEKKNE